MNKQIVIASSNESKINRFQEILKDYKIISMKELGLNIDVEESGETFLDNAVQKAEFIAKQLENKVCLADDSGIEIEYLGGFPGVKTKRWMEGTDRQRNLSIIEKMKGIPKEKRKIKFTIAIAVSDGKKTITEQSYLEGYVAEYVRGEDGFGFDEIFEQENGKTLAEEVEKEIKLRRDVIIKLKEKIDNMYT